MQKKRSHFDVGQLLKIAKKNLTMERPAKVKGKKTIREKKMSFEFSSDDCAFKFPSSFLLKRLNFFHLFVTSLIQKRSVATRNKRKCCVRSARRTTHPQSKIPKAIFVLNSGTILTSIIITHFVEISILFNSLDTESRNSKKTSGKETKLFKPFFSLVLLSLLFWIPCHPHASKPIPNEI